MVGAYRGELARMKWLWWKFRDLWCWPFGHVLYFPVNGYWECACSVNRIGSAGTPLRWQWVSMRKYWRRMRRPSQDCPLWDRHPAIYEHWTVCLECHNRLWVRV